MCPYMHAQIADGKLLGVRLPWSPLLRLHPSGIFSTDTLSLHHVLLYANENLFLGQIFNIFTVFSKFYIFSLLSQSFTYFHCCLKVLHIFTVVSKFYIFSLYSQSLHIFTVFSKFYIFSLFSQSFTYFHCCLKLLHIFTFVLKCYIFSLISRSFTYFHWFLKASLGFFSSFLYGICLNSV
jgi:hypothetical protein